MPSSSSSLALLEQRLGANWPHLAEACRLADGKRTELVDKLRGIDSEDTSVVVFGSLARREFTSGSDIDWTLLVDGHADPRHIELARRVEKIVNAASAKKPGREGTFGSLSFSHELVNRIGGEDDTNRNTTRRILLLLESAVVGRADAYDRVVTNILNRYVEEDYGFAQGRGPHRVPRFLLNDFARYWWTMAVDFAYKQRTRFGEGAAMRNMKLRMSRKLIYVSGLLTCFACELDCPAAAEPAEWVSYLRDRLKLPPIEILAGALLRHSHLDGTARILLGAYDEFLGVLADKTQRERLEELEPPEYEADAIYQRVRRLSHEFRDGLLELFFDKPSGLYSLTKNYGVF